LLEFGILKFFWDVDSSAGRPATLDVDDARMRPSLTPNHSLNSAESPRGRSDAFSQEDVDFLMRVAGQVAIAVEKALAYREIAE
jgi:GAF domain-containing protein